MLASSNLLDMSFEETFDDGDLASEQSDFILTPNEPSVELEEVSPHSEKSLKRRCFCCVCAVI